MRRLIFILTISAALAAPAFAARRHKEEQSSELKHCVQQCQQENKKDATAREACENQCTLADTARRQQQTITPMAPSRTDAE